MNEEGRELEEERIDIARIIDRIYRESFPSEYQEDQSDQEFQSVASQEMSTSPQPMFPNTGNIAQSPFAQDTTAVTTFPTQPDAPPTVNWVTDVLALENPQFLKSPAWTSLLNTMKKQHGNGIDQWASRQSATQSAYEVSEIEDFDDFTPMSDFELKMQALKLFKKSVAFFGGIATNDQNVGQRWYVGDLTSKQVNGIDYVALGVSSKHNKTANLIGAATWEGTDTVFQLQGTKECFVTVLISLSVAQRVAGQMSWTRMAQLQHDLEVERSRPRAGGDPQAGGPNLANMEVMAKAISMSLAEALQPILRKVDESTRLVQSSLQRDASQRPMRIHKESEWISTHEEDYREGDLTDGQRWTLRSVAAYHVKREAKTDDDRELTRAIAMVIRNVQDVGKGKRDALFSSASAKVENAKGSNFPASCLTALELAMKYNDVQAIAELAILRQGFSQETLTSLVMARTMHESRQLFKEFGTHKIGKVSLNYAPNTFLDVDLAVELPKKGEKGNLNSKGQH